MNNWIERNRAYTLVDAADNFSIAFAGMKFTDADLDKLAPKFERAAREMARLEAGAVKNPDENRKVTHFSDRIEYPKSALSPPSRSLPKRSAPVKSPVKPAGSSTRSWSTASAAPRSARS